MALHIFRNRNPARVKKGRHNVDQADDFRYIAASCKSRSVKRHWYPHGTFMAGTLVFRVPRLEMTSVIAGKRQAGISP